MHFTGQESQAFGPSQEIDARQETRVDDQRTQRQVGQREEEGARLARQEIRRQSLNGEENEKDTAVPSRFACSPRVVALR